MNQIGSQIYAGTKVFRLDDGELPFDANGCLTQAQLEKVFELDRRPTLVAFAASRTSLNAPALHEAARRYSLLADQHGWRSVNGGGAAEYVGMMGDITFHAKNLVGVAPPRFADLGMHPDAVNIITRNMGERKIVMGRLADIFVTAPGGGLGTIDETFGGIIAAAKHGQQQHILNIDGFWQPMIDGIEELHRRGLISRQHINATHVFTDVDSAISAGHAYFNSLKYRNHTDSLVQQKPVQSLASFLRRNKHYLPDMLDSFLEDHRDGFDAKRVGMILSGNIRKLQESDARLYEAFASTAAETGKELAQRGAVLVIAGAHDSGGLRHIAADAALKENGYVVWIRKGQTRLPIETKVQGRLMVVTLPRMGDVTAFHELFPQRMGYLPGGINTAYRLFESLTAVQTRIGSASFLHGYGVQPPTKEDERFPLVGYNIGNLWGGFARQVVNCDQYGYLGEGDSNLFQMLPRRASLADILCDRMPHPSQDPLHQLRL